MTGPMRGKKGKSKAKAEGIPADVRDALLAAAFVTTIFAGAWLWVFMVRR